jgi:sugar lactone lactonase YvrE
LRSLRADPRFIELSRRAQAQYPPVHHARIAFDVRATDLFPEGLAVDAASGTFYMGSMHHKKIVSFRLGGLARDFVREGAYDLMPVGGVHVEPTDHSVWASTDAGRKQQPELLHFDSSGHLLERYPSPGAMPYDLNDLVLHGDSEIFTTDTEGNHVYRFSRRARTFTALKLFRPVFDPNGITISADGRVLFVADNLGVIRVDLQTNDSQDVIPDLHDTLSGIDGLYWYGGDLIGVQYGTGKFRVVRWHLTPDGSRVVGHDLLEYRTPLVDDPTTGAIYGDVFYFMANTGIANLDNDEIVDRAKLAPVHIASVPLKQAAPGRRAGN